MRLYDILFKTIQKVKKPITYAGDVYWGNDTWVCPCDGFINMIVNSKASSSYLLVYITENDRHICTVTGVGASSTATAMFPVQKGKKYKTSYAINYGNICQALYYKVGGVVNKFRKALCFTPFEEVVA